MRRRRRRRRFGGSWVGEAWEAVVDTIAYIVLLEFLD